MKSNKSSFYFQRALLENRIQFLNLTHIMNTWTKQMGHPLVTVTIINSTHFSISQEQFLFDASQKPARSDYKWVLSNDHFLFCQHTCIFDKTWHFAKLRVVYTVHLYSWASRLNGICSQQVWYQQHSRKRGLAKAQRAKEYKSRLFTNAAADLTRISKF
jgi:hypothetical protein